ncbi:MAG: hypothetical protein HFG28_06900 [Eubacterium sp.]|nr:hypothetical protein [Eubacterium sp.]
MKKKIFLVSSLILITVLILIFAKYQIITLKTEKNSYEYSFEEENLKIYHGININNEISAAKLQEESLDNFQEKSYVDYFRGSFLPPINIGKGVLRNNNGFIYSIHKLASEQGYIICTYSEGSLIDCYHMLNIPSKMETLLKIHKGMKRTRLEKVDSKIKFVKDKQATTVHRFGDGTMLEIQYKKVKDNWEVKDYILYEDGINLLNRILKKDYDIVKNNK